jgi:tetratricopeptide (TPR) repeat protein
MKHELGDSYYEFGLMWKAKGDSEKAKEYLNKSLDIYEKLNLEKHMERVRKEL